MNLQFENLTLDLTFTMFGTLSTSHSKEESYKNNLNIISKPFVMKLKEFIEISVEVYPVWLLVFNLKFILNYI